MRNFLCLAMVPFLLSSAMSKGHGSGSIEPKGLYESLSKEERIFLSDIGYFARGSDHRKFSGLYQSLKDSSRPIYVTTDCVLHSYHVLFDYSLRVLEMTYLYPELTSLTKKMIDRTKALMKESTGRRKEALSDNLAYFEVAARLLDPDYAITKSVAKEVNAELDLINAGQGFGESPIFGYQEDYTQYSPRGHYTRNDILQRYFRAMMWYGRMSFRLMPNPDDQDNKQGRHQTIQALLVLEAQKDFVSDWERINSPIVLYLGKSDDLTPAEYWNIKNRRFAEDDLAGIADHDGKLTDFIEAALKYRAAGIISGLVWDTEEPSVTTCGMRFLGQKFIPDAYIFQNLVYDRVGTRTEPRLFPRGLDVMAVLGSDRAKNILFEEYKEGNFKNYQSQFEKMIDWFKGTKEKDWYTNLYWGWLYTLKSLLLPIPGFQPAYQDKSLCTALGSWAELRHDTILYAKQSYTVAITAMPPEPESITGYVEPIPEFYNRLKRLVELSVAGLAERALLDKTVKGKFERFANLLADLARIAQAEIDGTGSTEADYQLINNIGGQLESIETFPAVDYESESDKSNALVADVHSDPNTGQVLEVGNDVPAFIYVVVTVKGQPRLFVGGIFDYYEFLQPMNKRLTDEKWQALEPKPARPDWIKFFAR